VASGDPKEEQQSEYEEFGVPEVAECSSKSFYMAQRREERRANTLTNWIGVS
jgi:hypothetical protein